VSAGIGKADADNVQECLKNCSVWYVTTRAEIVRWIQAVKTKGLACCNDLHFLCHPSKPGSAIELTNNVECLFSVSLKENSVVLCCR
jgi:hypothetical protein